MRIVTVPGALEIPLALQKMANTGKFDALIALGAVIRGETYHFEIVSNESASGITAVALDTGVPIANGILTTNDDDQALARMTQKGEECALAAIEMANLLKSDRMSVSDENQPPPLPRVRAAGALPVAARRGPMPRPSRASSPRRRASTRCDAEYFRTLLDGAIADAPELEQAIAPYLDRAFRPPEPGRARHPAARGLRAHAPARRAVPRRSSTRRSSSPRATAAPTATST